MTAPIVDPQGFVSLSANIGIRDDAKDFVVIVSSVPATSSAVFTQSRFAGPSIEISRHVAATGRGRAIAVISKNANVACGDPGRRDADLLQLQAAALVGCDPEEMFIASTGVIGRRYPAAIIEQFFDGTSFEGRPADFDQAAAAIMTTDTHPKVARATVGGASIVGIAKGVGMIEPDMATLLTFFFTDAAVEAPALDAMFRRVVDRTFNALSIDTDTSTSDSAIVIANALAGPVDHEAFEAALGGVALALVRMIAADGEGASKTIEATIRGAVDVAQAKRIAKLIVNSPLVKTAVHGADPNWGRIAMAIGKSNDPTIDQDHVIISIGGLVMYPPAAGESALAAAAEHMAGDVTLIEVDLGAGDSMFTAYGCDLTDGYVRINADYTT